MIRSYQIIPYQVSWQKNSGLPENPLIEKPRPAWTSICDCLIVILGPRSAPPSRYPCQLPPRLPATPPSPPLRSLLLPCSTHSAWRPRTCPQQRTVQITLQGCNVSLTPEFAGPSAQLEWSSPTLWPASTPLWYESRPENAGMATRNMRSQSTS